MPQYSAYPTAVALDGDEWVLILDDPAGVPTLKKVRVDAIPGMLGFASAIVKPSDTSRDSTGTGITLTADPHLVLPLLANTKYVFEIGLYIVTAAAPDWKHQLYAPAGASMIYSVDKRSDNALNDLSAVNVLDTNAMDNSVVYTDTAIVVAYMLLKGAITNGATAGNFGINWAQNTASATATVVKANSYIRLNKAS